MVAPELRIGSHPGFGRVVFDFPDFVDYRLSREGDRVLIRFAKPTVISDPASVPRNVMAIVAHDGVVEIDLVHGAQLRPARMGNRVVLDALDPPRPVWSEAAARPAPGGRAPLLNEAVARPASAPPAPAQPAHQEAPAPAPAPAPASTALAAAKPAPSRAAEPPVKQAAPSPRETATLPPAPQPIGQPAATPEPAPPAAARPASASVASPASAEPIPGPAAANALTAPVDPVRATAIKPDATADAAARPGPADDPMQLAARLAALPPGIPGSSAFLPLGPQSGAAAFRRGETGVAVFDERAPLDLAALRDDPILGKAAIQLLPAATLLTVKLPPGNELRLTPVARGWLLTVTSAVMAPRPIAPSVEGSTLKFPADAAAQVVAVPDPETGETLLVGTQRKSGQGVGVVRHMPQFVLDPSWQGVVVDPLSDRVAMRSEPDGFVLSAGDKPLDLSAEPASVQAAADAARLTRRYDLPDLPVEALMRRMQDQMVAAAAAPPQARAEPRRRAAEAMVALGMGPEAQSLLKLAVEDDPRAAGPDVAGLNAIAALVGGRTAESAAIDDPALTGTDEIALWRAVRAARLREGAPQAAAVFANALPLILSYPAALRGRLLPLAAETMALGGAAPAAQKLVASRPDDPTLAYARGLLLAGQGDTNGALAVFDALAHGRDQFDSARAAEQAVELRLASAKITPAQAADALEKQFLAWRGDDRELHLRLRVVDLRTRAGQFRPALALLRETAADWPDQRDAMRARMGDVLSALLQKRDADAISPIDLVALAGDNADVLPTGQAGEQLAVLLADKLAALDLPRRAAPVLQKLMQAASGVARATYGARLAEVQLRDGDPAAAHQSLVSSNADGLSPELVVRRTMLEARILARQGNPADAASLLAGVDDPAADELRADIAESAKDWSGAEMALRSLVGRRVPATGDLDAAQQSLVLRYASAASQAGDGTALRDLREQQGKRMQQGKLGNMFKLLTADPVKTVADLPRAAAEASLVRAVPAGLQALRAP